MSIFSKVYGVAMCYNEEDFILKFLENVVAQNFDGLVILDHFSTDGTPQILEDFRYGASKKDFDLHILYTENRAFDKVQKINGLAALANFRAWHDKNYRGNTWIVPMDIDEIWTCNEKPLADQLKEKTVLSHSFYNHMRNYILTPEGYEKYYLTANDPRQQPRGEKCCFVWHPDIWCTSGFHNIMRKNEGQIRVLRADWLIVKHYPYRSFLQVKNKYRNLHHAILIQKKRDPNADIHSMVRGSMNDKEFLTWYNNNCFSKDPESDRGLVKEA